MPHSAAAPQTLEDWLNQLEHLRLPVARSHHEQMLRTLRDNRRSLREIAERMQSSPVIALAILREANNSGGSFREPAESLEMALNRLGLQRAEQVLNRLEVKADAEIPVALRQLLLIGQHATQQANGLFAGRLARLWQEVHWNSLLFLAPLWPLTLHQPDFLASWEQRVLARGEPLHKVEQELLGVPLLQLCQALAQRWHLPEWIQQGYRLLLDDRRLLAKALRIAHDHEHPLHQQQMLDADPALRRWLTLPSNCILLANGIALSSHHNWSCSHHLRWQQLTGLYLQMGRDELQPLLHQHAVSSAHEHAEPGLWHPAEALLWPWDASRLRQPEPPAAKREPSSEWLQQCQRLLAQPSAFNNTQQLTDCAAQALQAGGLRRVLLLLCDREHSRLHAQQARGLAPDATSLRLDPTTSQVLRKLLSEPGQLRLSPDNQAQLSALLPGSLKALFLGDHLLLRSIAHRGRVVMLLVADSGGGAIDSHIQQAFARTAQCIERALDGFARRGA